MATPEELHRWIAETRARQRKMTYVFAAAVAVCFGLILWNGAVGALALVCVAGTAIVAFWVTYAHNQSHHQKLDELAKAKRRGGVPETVQRGGHRRWRSS